MILLIFKSFGNSKQSQKACNGYFFQNQKYINNACGLRRVGANIW